MGQRRYSVMKSGTLKTEFYSSGLVLFSSLILTLSLRFFWFSAVGYDEGIYLLIS